MSSPITPMLALGVTSYANNWYNHRRDPSAALDVKPLLFAGIGALILGGFGALPGMDKTATLLGWTAFIGMLISPVQKPSPVENLLKISRGQGGN